MGEYLSDDERLLVRHTLGLNRRNESYGNHFCASDTHSELPTIKALMARGLMRISHKINDGRDTIYVVTPEGLKVLEAQS